MYGMIFFKYLLTLKLFFMKLESLELDKFKGNALKREQMFKLDGGGTVTPGGHGCGTGTLGSNNNVNLEYDFGYDSDRGDGFITYHDRTNVRQVAMCIG